MTTQTITDADKEIILRSEYENWQQQAKAQAHKQVTLDIIKQIENARLEAYAATRNHGEGYSDWQRRVAQEEVL